MYKVSSEFIYRKKINFIPKTKAELQSDGPITANELYSTRASTDSSPTRSDLYDIFSGTYARVLALQFSCNNTAGSTRLSM